MKTIAVIYCQVLCLLSRLTFAFDEFRILGGTAAIIETHPWDVSIQTFNRTHICGGAIITNTTILTAAHCVVDRNMVRDCQVVAGSTDFTATEGAVMVRISECLKHPRYNRLNYDFDIAILKLAEPLNYSSKIQAIKLPNADYKFEGGVTLVMSGWGVSEKSIQRSTRILQETTIDVIDWNECRSKLVRLNAFTNRMFCAGLPDGTRDTCQGDSGGPVEVNGTLVGVVSWGIGCGLQRFPGVYASLGVPSIRNWIKKTSGLI